MCGIVGIATLREVPSPSNDQLQAMCDSIIHRGPEGEGIAIQDAVGLRAGAGFVYALRCSSNLFVNSCNESTFSFSKYKRYQNSRLISSHKR